MLYFHSILVSKTHKSANWKLWHLSHKGPHPLGTIPCPTTPKRCRAAPAWAWLSGSHGRAGQGRAVGTWSPALLQPLRGRALGWRRDLGRGREPPKPMQQCLGLAARSRLPVPSPHRTAPPPTPCHRGKWASFHQPQPLADTNYTQLPLKSVTSDLRAWL